MHKGSPLPTFPRICFMRLFIFFLIGCFYFHDQLSFAQAIDNTASFRMINADRYVRLHYENDYFTASDKYYTQGINLEVVSPAMKKFPLNRLLPASKSSRNQYGVAVEHNGYTPGSIRHVEILYGDRPFAASLFLKNFVRSNLKNQCSLNASLSLGVIGPTASGYWMQSTIHRWIHNLQPLGWPNQIKNDVILNYETGIEKNFLSVKKIILINGFANGRLGTYNDKLSTGLVVMFGKLNPTIASVFCKNEPTQEGTKRVREKFSFHFYMQPVLSAVAYDATLQGGMFNRKSPYTISDKEMQRITFQGNYGLVINFRRINIEYFQSVLTKEYATGHVHRWGGIRLALKI
jgi:lipid A 3-O-deacylase